MLKSLGIGYRARLLISGEEFVIEGIRKNQVCLVFLANDASDNAKKKILDKAKYYDIEVIQDYSSDELSNAIGKENRMVIGITSRNFASSLLKKR